MQGLGPTAKGLAGLSPCLSFPRRGQKLAGRARGQVLSSPGHGKLRKFTRSWTLCCSEDPS